MQNKNIKKDNPLTLYSFIWRYLKHKKCYLFSFIIVSVIWSIEISLSPYLLKTIIDKVSSHHQNNELPSILLIPISLYVIMSLILNLNFVIYDYISLKLYPKLKADITKDIYSHLISHSSAYFQNNFTGSLMKKILDMPSNLELMFRTVNESFFPVICAIISSTFTLFIGVHYLFSIILILWSVFFIILSYIASKKLEVYSENLAEYNIDAGGKISDSISNIISIKLFASKNYEILKIDNVLKNVINVDCKVQWQNLKINFIQGIGMSTLILALLLLLTYSKMENIVTTGDFVLVLTLSISILMSTYNIGHEIQKFAKMKGLCVQALSIIQEKHEIIDLPNAKPIKILDGLIEFKNVTFNYEGKKNLFNNLNVIIHPGEKVGLVGRSGSGKSTFIKLILRLADTKSGTILIDGQDVKTVTNNSLINSLTTISQPPGIFNRTIIENIRFACQEATDSEVIDAAKKAKCNNFINKLPEGYETLVGEGGIKLSSGQIQRIALARAFLKKSPILLLDEATSALDNITEYSIQQSLYELMKNKTTIVIAHRLHVLKKMDRILVFNNGQIVEDGDFKTLSSNKNSNFFKLWKV